MTQTKIDERRKREAYDRAHPWVAMPEAMANTGIVCELLFSDMVVTDKHYFLGEDDVWYQIAPPAKIHTGTYYGNRKPMNWRPVDPAHKLTPARRFEVMNEANKQAWP